MNERIERWSRLVEAEPDNELARFSLAQVLFEAKEWDEALQHYDVALRLKPDWMMAVIQKGQCLIRLGRIDEAKAALMAGKELARRQGHKGPQEEIDEILSGLP